MVLVIYATFETAGQGETVRIYSPVSEHIGNI